jgi:hypothetical protein
MAHSATLASKPHHLPIVGIPDASHLLPALELFALKLDNPWTFLHELAPLFHRLNKTPLHFNAAK